MDNYEVKTTPGFEVYMDMPDTCEEELVKEIEKRFEDILGKCDHDKFAWMKEYAYSPDMEKYIEKKEYTEEELKVMMPIVREVRQKK